MSGGSAVTITVHDHVLHAAGRRNVTIVPAVATGPGHLRDQNAM